MTFCENANADDTPGVIGEIGKGTLFEVIGLDNPATVPTLIVLKGAMTVEGCSRTLFNDWAVTFFEDTMLDDTLTGLDSEANNDWLVAFWGTSKLDLSNVDSDALTSSPIDLDGTGNVCTAKLLDDSNAVVLTAETV